MSLDPPTTISVTPPTPASSETDVSSPPPNATAAAAAAATDADAADDHGDDDGTLQPVADDRIDRMSEWLRHHVDIFSHLSEGLINMTFLADRTATQYDRLLAAACCPSVCPSVCL